MTWRGLRVDNLVFLWAHNPPLVTLFQVSSARIFNSEEVSKFDVDKAFNPETSLTKNFYLRCNIFLERAKDIPHLKAESKELKKKLDASESFLDYCQIILPFLWDYREALIAALPSDTTQAASMSTVRERACTLRAEKALARSIARSPNVEQWRARLSKMALVPVLELGDAKVTLAQRSAAADRLINANSTGRYWDPESDASDKDTVWHLANWLEANGVFSASITVDPTASDRGMFSTAEAEDVSAVRPYKAGGVGGSLRKFLKLNRFKGNKDIQAYLASNYLHMLELIAKAESRLKGDQSAEDENFLLGMRDQLGALFDLDNLRSDNDREGSYPCAEEKDIGTIVQEAYVLCTHYIHQAQRKDLRVCAKFKKSFQELREGLASHTPHIKNGRYTSSSFLLLRFSESLAKLLTQNKGAGKVPELDALRAKLAEACPDIRSPKSLADADLLLVDETLNRPDVFSQLAMASMILKQHAQEHASELGFFAAVSDIQRILFSDPTEACHEWLPYREHPAVVSQSIATIQAALAEAYQLLPQPAAASEDGARLFDEKHPDKPMMRLDTLLQQYQRLKQSQEAKASKDPEEGATHAAWVTHFLSLWAYLCWSFSPESPAAKTNPKLQHSPAMFKS